MKVWFDITNTPQVHFLLAILNGIKTRGFCDFLITARDFSETKSFLKSKTDLPFTTIGSHEGKNLHKKAIGLINRFSQIHKKINSYDVSISCGSESAVWSSYLKGKRSLAFGDNDLARQWTYGYFVTYAMFPASIPTERLSRQGLNKNKLYQYDGFKEHVYIADYKPAPDFLTSLPFREYVVVRPENIMANYVHGEITGSITPKLLKLLSDKGINILFLPRYDSDKQYASGIKNVFIPEGPVNGLDACYYSAGVFTGAGTFAREAACLGVPSFSFFLGERLLAVDKALVKQNELYFSRDPDLLVEKFIFSERSIPDFNKAKAVYNEVITKTIELLIKY